MGTEVARMGILGNSVWNRNSSIMPQTRQSHGVSYQRKCRKGEDGMAYPSYRSFCIRASLVTRRVPSSGPAQLSKTSETKHNFVDPRLSELDPEIHAIIEQETQRRFKGLELIASKNFTSRVVMEAVGSCLTNKYSDCLPGKRYYGGNEFIDQSEKLCQDRALAAFCLDNIKWGVNVQPLSGSPTNFSAYTTLLHPHDQIMGLDLPHGGHLSHGFMTAKRQVSATSIYFESMPYHLDESTRPIDYEMLEKKTTFFRTKPIGSARQ